MGCNNCRDFDQNSCTDIISSTCVKWEGESFEELDICTKDSLTYIGTFILNKIKDLLKGRGILLPDLTLSDCEYIDDLLDTDEKNLLNVLRVYKEAICQLKADLIADKADLAAFTDVSLYVLSCLDPNDPCGDPLTFKSLIQAIITKLCALDSQLESIASTILQVIEDAVGNFLLSGHIVSEGGNGIIYSGVGDTAVVKFQALVPPNCPIIYTGSTGLFNGSGVGLPNTSVAGWYLCNGSNGTPTHASLPQNGGGTIKYIIRFT